MDSRIGIDTTIGEVTLYPGVGMTNAFYVVSLQPEGFVIVAADDRAGSVLAFSLKGQFDPSPDSPLFRMLQNDVPVRVANAQVQALQASRTSRLAPAAKAPAAPPVTSLAVVHPSPADEICRVRVAPLLQSRWAQGYASSTEPIFNYYTPSNAAAGNVAMCLAQIIRHHRQQPAGGVGVKPYLAYVNENETWLHTRGGDGYGGPYDWDAMVDDPLATSLTLEQRQAIGSLCADVGIAVTHADYDVRHGTWDSSWDVTNALKHVYGFAKGGVRGLYNGWDPLWDYAETNDVAFGMINANLDAGLPVVLSLMPADPAAKFLVAADCDGYGYSRTETGETWMFHHLNMARGSANEDIWYTLPVVPAGIGFSNIFRVIYNIMPTNAGEIVSGRVTDQDGISMPGITMQITDGGTYTNTTQTGIKGIYSFIVPPNTTYTISVVPPVGANSWPAQRVVTVGESVDGYGCGNVWAQNFKIPSHLIMGRIIKDGAPLVRAQVTFSNLLTTTTDLDGVFIQPVPNHWSGSLVPWLSIGGSFDPAATNLVDVTADITNIVFRWTAPTMCAVSGTVFDVNFDGVSDVTLSFSGVDVTTTNDENGDYVAYVPINWSGTLTPSHPDGGSFFPPALGYTNLVSDIGFQSFYWSAPVSNSISGRIIQRNTGKPVAGVVLTCSGTGDSVATDTNGAYTLVVPYRWSGSITPSHARGGSFRPSATRSYSDVHSNIEGENYQWTPPPPTLNGYVMRADAPYGPVVGATITLSTGGTTKSQQDGSYSINIPYGWSGTATPSHPVGGSFSPTNVAQTSPLLEDALVQNFSWTPPVQAITGRVTRAGTTTPVSGATVLFVNQIYIAGTYGSPYTPVLNGGTDMPVQTDTNGMYRLVVPYGWTGVLIASHPRGGGFAPITHTRFNMRAMAVNCLVTNFNLNTMDLTAFNFSWTPPQPFIQGHVYRGDGDFGAVGGVTIAFDGGFTAITADDGSYSNAFPFGWIGSATPSHPAGGTFDPTSMDPIDLDLLDSWTQNYRWYPPEQTVSGRVTRIDNGLPVTGISVTFSNAPGLSQVPVINNGASVTVLTDSNGYYGLTVPYGWSGSTTPAHPYGGTFIPSQYQISSISEHRAEDDFTWSAPPPVVSGRIIRSDTGAGVAGISLIFSNAPELVAAGASNLLALVETDAEGAYNVPVGFGWSGTITPYISGVSAYAELPLVPVRRSFTNVTEDIAQTNATQFVYTPFLEIVGTGADRTVDFGEVLVTKSVTRSVVIKNNSQYFCQILGAQPPDGFDVIPIDFVSPGATRVVNITFHPQDSLVFTGAVLWATLPQPISGFPAIRVRGQGKYWYDFVTAAGDLDFGTVFVGQKTNRTIYFTNHHTNQPVQLKGRWLNGTDFSTHGLPVTIPAGETRPVTVRFTPKSGKDYSGATLYLQAVGLPEEVYLNPTVTVLANVAGTWSAKINRKNYLLYMDQDLGTVNGLLVCQDPAIEDQYLAGFLMGGTTGQLWQSGVPVGNLALTLSGSSLAGRLTRNTVGTNLKVSFRRVSPVIPGSVVMPPRPAARLRPLAAMGAPSELRPDALRLQLLQLAQAEQLPEDAPLMSVIMSDGKLVLLAPAPELSPLPYAMDAQLDATGIDRNTNGVPDALETAIGFPLRDGMELFELRKQGGYAVPGLTVDGLRIEGGATRLDQLPGAWFILPQPQP